MNKAYQRLLSILFKKNADVLRVLATSLSHRLNIKLLVLSNVVKFKRFFFFVYFLTFGFIWIFFTSENTLEKAIRRLIINLVELKKNDKH